MPDFKVKMHQIRFRLGLCPRPRWGSLQRSCRPLAEFKRPTSKGREGKGRYGEGGDGRGQKLGKGGEGDRRKEREVKSKGAGRCQGPRIGKRRACTVGLPVLALCGRMNSPPWLNTRATEAGVEVMHKQQLGV